MAVAIARLRPRQDVERPCAAPDRIEIVIPESVPSPCITQGVDVPGWTDESKAGQPERQPVEPMMFWPFNHFSRSRSDADRTIGSIYGMIVARARERGFYEGFGIPDTVDGRFDLLLLHLWMVLRQLAPAGSQTRLSQGLFDHFCSDMDANLREMGVGDLTVPKRMQKFGEAFYGRSNAYNSALTAGHEALAQALCKNVFNGAQLEQARRLASYVEASLQRLSAYDASAFARGEWQFAPLQ